MNPMYHPLVHLLLPPISLSSSIHGVVVVLVIEPRRHRDALEWAAESFIAASYWPPDLYHQQNKLDTEAASLL